MLIVLVRHSPRVVMHGIRGRRSTKRHRTGEEGKERTTQLMVALHASGYNVEVYLACLYDLVDVLSRRVFKVEKVCG